jgi:isochorismate hydrolase
MPRSRRSAKAGLLIIDMINEYRFDDADKLFPAIEQTAAHIAHLKRQMKARSLPVVYVNDNLGKWQSQAGDSMSA